MTTFNQTMYNLILENLEPKMFISSIFRLLHTIIDIFPTWGQE